MDPRKEKILTAIVRQFIETAEPVGSNAVMISYKLSVSPATIRNDMAYLEKEGLIYQPHTSAGRVPTNQGYRLFIDQIVDYKKARQEAKKNLAKIYESYQIQKTREKIFDAVALLAQSTNNVSFATLPDQNRTFYLGIANILKQPEFRHDPLKASQVVEVFEKDDNFLNVLHSLKIDNTIKTFIGEENLLPQIKSCSLIITQYQINDQNGFIGLLGPTRMKYAYNAIMLEEIHKLLMS